MQSVQALTSAVEAKAAEAGGTLGYGTYLRTIAETFKSLALQQIDTEEERDAIKNAALTLADRFVAPKFGSIWAVVRPTVDWTIDEYMDRLPALLA